MFLKNHSSKMCVTICGIFCNKPFSNRR
ncbi:DUF6783 domain-containing protein [Ruminococcus sp. J1101004sp1_RTP21198st1_B9_RTP21198_201120]